MKMFDASPWGSPSLGQFGINNPYSGAGSPYSWNAPRSFPGASPMSFPAGNLQRPAPWSQPALEPGGYAPQAVAAEDCYTCTNPDSGDTKYGVPAAQAKDLKAKGYKCRKDNCARPSDGGYGRFGSFGGGFFGAPSSITPGSFQAPEMESYSMMSGARGIPLVRGLGTRALE